MNRTLCPDPLRAAQAQVQSLAAALCLALLFLPLRATAQAITIDSKTGTITSTGQSADKEANVDRRYRQIQPTHIALPAGEIDAKSRIELERALQSEQGFAMRPFPKSRKGLTLVANGKLDPAGEDYLATVVKDGLSAKPGDRLILTDVKIEKNHILFELNNGPEGKHRFLRHISVGGNGGMAPVVRDIEPATGARLTLAFDKHVPVLSAQQVKALLAPLISFDVKTPIQAFTDTLPSRLKDAILGHQVLVGMSTEMLLYSMGQPETKMHEIEGNTPFDEWIYGKPPKDVEFVRINGNRVIRVEVAKVGKTPEVFTTDEVAGLMRTDGSPLTASAQPVNHGPKLGDVQRDPDKQAPAPPPSLRNPGEALPEDQRKDSGVMKPVVFPKPKPDADPDAQPAAQPAPAQPQPAQPR